MQSAVIESNELISQRKVDPRNALNIIFSMRFMFSDVYGAIDPVFDRTDR
jgi:hypothetical protein